MSLFKWYIHCCIGKDVLNQQLKDHKYDLSVSLGNGIGILCHGSLNYESEILN